MNNVRNSVLTGISSVRNNTLPTYASYFAVLAVSLLVGALLLPQGVGFKTSFDLPKIDLPRLSMLAMLIAAIFFIFRSRHVSAFQIAPRTLMLLTFVAGWQVLSAVMTNAGIWPYYWAFGNFVAFWGFAVAFIVLAGHREFRSLVVPTLITLGVVVALWAAAEFISQEKLIAYRNLYDGDHGSRGFSYEMRRQILGVGGFPYMSLGPYFIHHTLAAVLCALGGFLVLGSDKRKSLWFFLGTSLLTFAIFSTQSRAGIMAYIAMLTIGLCLHETWHGRLMIVSGAAIGLLLFIPLFGGVDNFSMAFFYNTRSDLGILDIYNKIQAIGIPNLLHEHSIAAGTAEGRLAGLMMLLSQVDQWWLYGTGPGSLLNQERIASQLVVYSDQGSFIWISVESGLPVGIALTVGMIACLHKGLRYPDWQVKAAALGLGSFWLFTLIQIGLQSWTIGMVLMGLVEAWSRNIPPTSCH